MLGFGVKGLGFRVSPEPETLGFRVQGGVVSSEVIMKPTRLEELSSSFFPFSSLSKGILNSNFKP